VFAIPPHRSLSRDRSPAATAAASPLRLRPAAALGPADAGELLGRVEAFLYTVAEAQVEGMQAQILAAFIMRKKLKDPRGKV